MKGYKSKPNMNNDNIKFLETNGINPEEMREKVDCRISTLEEINPIVADYAFQKATVEKEVSVADIVGRLEYREKESRDIFESMDGLFDSRGDGYHSRSVGMLEYNKSNILENLKSSFLIEPISLCETGEGQYVVYINGLHRCTILRILYLKEIADANNNEQKIQEINKKYTISADVTGINLEKTYCKYILMNIPPIDSNKSIYDISRYFDRDNCCATDYINITFYPREIITVSEKELIELTRRTIEKYIQDVGKIPQIIIDSMNKFKSFKFFIEKEFGDLLKKVISFDEKKGEEHD